MKDYYKILGIQPGADADTVRKAYRNLAKTYHPDLNNSAQANAFFIELNEAYSTLNDEAARILYDQRYLVLKQKEKQSTQFHYDWTSMQHMNSVRKKKPEPAGQAMQIAFGAEMFIGFTEGLLVLGYIFRGPIHPVYGVVAIPGVLLVIDGWKGIVGRKSVLGGIVKAFKKLL
jgi:curved DNA-binding protein CbpA